MLSIHNQKSMPVGSATPQAPERGSKFAGFIILCAFFAPLIIGAMLNNLGVEYARDVAIIVFACSCVFSFLVFIFAIVGMRAALPSAGLLAIAALLILS